MGKFLGMCALLCFFCSHASSTQAAVIFSDDFESGDFLKTSGGAKWTSREKVSMAVSGAHSGTYAAKYLFPGNVDPAKDAWAEMRFDLGALFPEVWIQFELFIPANFKHRAVSPSNNKFFRLWPATYSDKAKIGASYSIYSGAPQLKAEWIAPSPDTQGMTMRGTRMVEFISGGDLGKWIRIKIRATSPTATKPGTVNIWKNDVLVVDNTDTMNADVSAGVYAYRYGYLLGWANSGFDEDTTFLIDDVTFATTQADLPSGVIPPTAPDLSVQ